MNVMTIADNITILPAANTPAAEEQMRALLREVAEFNAIYETVQEKLKAREQAIEKKLALASQQLSKQLIDIQQTLQMFASFMTEEGAARARMAVKVAREEGQASLNALQDAGAEIKQLIDETSQKLESATTQTLNNVAEIAKKFPADEFKQVAQQSCDDIKTTSAASIKQIVSFVNVFHRKNLIMAFVLTLFMAFILGLYLNGEWPWEIHRQVVKERNAGRALLIAWPKLSAVEQQQIINAANRNPIL